MNQNSGVVFHILDAGARFGIHESWKGFQGPAKFFLFEPEPEEEARLRTKYAGDPRMRVLPIALHDKNGELRLNRLKHRGGTTSLTPDPGARYWTDARPGTGKIEDQITARAMTMDSWCKEQKVSLDFCKIDVEGAEEFVLRGGREQLENHILGARVEISFNSLYEGQPETFSLISQILRSYGFMFLNLDAFFCNSQVPYSDLHIGEKFGQLMGADGIWVKPPESIVPPAGSAIDPGRVLKMAYFAMRNGATDLAMALLLKSAERGVTMVPAHFKGADRAECERALFELERVVAKLTFDLRDVPRYGSDYLGSVFERVFEKKWVGPGEYYQRYPLGS